MLLDILPTIFANLSVVDLLRCRQVCKAWRYMVERDSFKELCLCVGGQFYPDVWALDGQLIDERIVLTVRHLTVLSNPNFQQTFQNVKRAVIKYNWYFRLSDDIRMVCNSRNEELKNLNLINHFEELEHLEIHGATIPTDVKLELSGLKKFFCEKGYEPTTQALPPNLETFGIFEFLGDKLVSKIPDGLKVLISHDYSKGFLRLANLEELHLNLLEKKPTVFVGRFPKLRLLDIHRVNRDKHMKELLQELATLKRTRNQSVKFYYGGCDISVYINEKLSNRRQTNLNFKKGWTHYINVYRLLSAASQSPDLVLPFSFFHRTFYICGEHDEEISSSIPISFEILKGFRNTKKIIISGSHNYQHIRKMLENCKQVLIFGGSCKDSDEQQFIELLEDLPGLLENLVRISLGCKPFLKSLKFLNRLRKLIAFEIRFEKNEKNQEIFESIEKRRKSMTYPLFYSHPVAIDDMWCRNSLYSYHPNRNYANADAEALAKITINTPRCS